ncbi:hypothetical protein ACFX13_043480 [Malus domestica]
MGQSQFEGSNSSLTSTICMGLKVLMAQALLVLLALGLKVLMAQPLPQLALGIGTRGISDWSPESLKPSVRTQIKQLDLF